MRMLNRTGFLLALLVLALGSSASAAEAAQTMPAAQSMEGKVFVGYQGWFEPQDASGKWIWFHYGRGGTFAPGHCVIDMWPEVSDLGPDERVPTAFRHADGDRKSVV